MQNNVYDFGGHPKLLAPFACWETSGDKAQGQAACGPDWSGGGFDEESAAIGEIIGARANKGAWDCGSWWTVFLYLYLYLFSSRYR
jgi:hypothetical protein